MTACRTSKSPGSSVTRVVAAAVVAMLAAGCASKPAATSSPPIGVPTSGAPIAKSPTTPAGSAPSAQGPCQSSQVTVALGSSFGAAAGTTYRDIVLTNLSRQTCSVVGAAQVTVTDASHRDIPIQVSTPPDTPVAVTLPPGQSAAEYLGYSSDGNPAPGQSACAPVESYLEVTIPGGTKPAQLSGWGQKFCPNDSIVLGSLVAGITSGP